MVNRKRVTDNMDFAHFHSTLLRIRPINAALVRSRVRRDDIASFASTVFRMFRKETSSYMESEPMGLSPLLPIAGATVSSLAGKALDTISRGPSFLEVLRGAVGADNSPADVRDAATESSSSPEELAEDLKTLVRKLEASLRAVRANSSVPIELKSDGRGGVVLENPHPARAAIEQILVNDATLREEFHRLAARTIALHGREEPSASGETEDFRLRLDDDGGRVRVV
jgi:hypothetical protein